MGYNPSPLQLELTQNRSEKFVSDNEHFIDCLEYEITGLQNTLAKHQFTIDKQTKQLKEQKEKICEF